MIARAARRGARPALLAYRELPTHGLDPRCIEALWQLEASQPLHQRVLPDGRMDLVAHGLHEDQDLRRPLARVRLAIAGPADGPATFRVPAGTTSFGMRFRIGWGRLCLGVEPAGLRNAVVSGQAAERLIGAEAKALLDAPTVDALHERLVGLAQTLAARACPTVPDERAHRAIARLQADMPRSSAALLCTGLGVAERTLRRDMLAAVGLPLRTLAGVLRFQHALAQATEHRSLSEWAFDSGYADQAHMTREFRRFGGFTPAMPEPAPRVGIGIS